MYTMIRKILCGLLLLGDSKPSVADKASYLLNLMATFGPIAFFLDLCGWWYSNNEQFFNFVLLAIIINIFVGAAYHTKMKTFSWHKLITRNSVMIVVIIIVYVLLEMLRLTAGDNWAGESFKIVIQIATLLYPISKILKNIYILSNKQHPPAFIMERLYNFEKSGKLDELFGGKNDQNSEDI